VLSNEDRWRLAVIEALVRAEDLPFAESLRLGRPRRPRGDQRWPFQLALGFGLLLFLVGLGSAVIDLIIVGGVIAIAGWRGDRHRRISRHRSSWRTPN